MKNTISEGRDKLQAPDKDGVVERRPTTGLEDLKAEILAAAALKTSAQTAESRARSSVESRTDLRLAAVNELSRGDPQRAATLEVEKNVAQNWADLDASDYGRLRSPLRKEAALESIAANMRSSPEYAEEIKLRSPILADAAAHLNEERQKLEAQAAREASERRSKDEIEARSSSRLSVIDAAAMARLAALVREQSAAVSESLAQQPEPFTRPDLSIPHRLFDTIGTQDEMVARKAIEKRSEELSVTPANRLDQAVARDAVRDDLVAIRKIENKTERHFAALVMNENAQTHPGYKAELRRQDPLIAKEADAAVAENTRRIIAKEDRKVEDMEATVASKRPVKRPIEEVDISESMLKRFIVSKEKNGLFDKGRTEFSFRNGENQGVLAFVDTGKNLSTERQDKETIRSMIEVSVAKGWKEITVSGTDEFRRAAWLEGRLNNLEVRGYEPREADKTLLAELVKDKAQPNKIELNERETRRDGPSVSRGKPTKAEHINGDALTSAEKTVLANSRELVKDKGPKFEEAVARELEARLRGERVFIGQVVSHGNASYKFDPKNEASYFVTLKTPRGEQTVWGKHLDTALAHGQVGEGDSVVLRNIGKKDVEVSERIFDDAGKVTGTRSKAAVLNTWTAEPLERFSVQAREEMEARRQQSTPKMRVYDARAERSTAPSQSVQQLDRVTDRFPPNRDR